MSWWLSNINYNKSVAFPNVSAIANELILYNSSTNKMLVLSVLHFSYNAVSVCLSLSRQWKVFKVPLLWLWKVHIWFWESPTTGWHACKVKKHFNFLIICLYFTLFAQRLPNDLLNDSFFQTPPLRDANLRWLFRLETAIFNAPKAAPSGYCTPLKLHSIIFEKSSPRFFLNYIVVCMVKIICNCEQTRV